ncbi:hypothetical protein BJF90_34840 [Pseudonocardia sp. CNS-004]|nr:hypothetical protein BJF90_34840 [Pseudonocardia sp. CNS-004]
MAGEARGQVRVAVGRPQGVPMLATAEGWQIGLWDPATGQTIGEPLVPPAHVRALVVASVPALLVAACEGGLVVVWDVDTRLPVTTFEIPEPAPRALAVGELDGRWVVAVGGSSGVLHVRSLDGDQIQTVSTKGSVRDAALATIHGRLYAAVGGGDGVARVYDVALGAPELVAVPLGREINAVALAPARDRLVLAAGSADGSAQMWDAETGAALSEALEHGNEVRSVAMTTTGHQQLLATGSSDRTARVWYVSDGSSTGPPLPHPAPVESVAFGEVDGRMMLATGCLDGNTRLWDPVQASGPRVAVEGWMPAVGLDADIVAAGVEGGSVQIWDRVSGGRYPDLTLEPGDEPVYKSLRGPEVNVRLGVVEGRRTLVTLYRGRAAAWDLSDLHAPTLRGTTTAIHFHLSDTVVSGNRALLASVDPSGVVHVVDLLVDEPIFPASLRDVNQLRFVPSPGRALLAVEDDAGVHLLDAARGAPVSASLPTTLPSHAAVGRLDGTNVLAMLDTDGLRLHDLRSGELTLPPLEMSNTANGIAWVRVGDRELLVTAHYATVRVWNPRTGRKVSELPFGTEIASMAVHSVADHAATIAVSGPGVVLVDLHSS